MKKLINISIVALLLVASFTISVTAGDNKAAISAIVKSMKARYPIILKVKREGIIGENSQRYVEQLDTVKSPTKELLTLIKEENADRKKLYALLADEMKVSIDTIAKRNAVRNFKKAEKGCFLKKPDGTWVKK